MNKLFKVDSKGKIRVYYIEIILDQYRMITGVLNGKEVTSKWTTAKAKNIGKTNATSGDEQALKEAFARYDKKRAEGYYTSEKEALNNPEGSFFKPMLAGTWEKAGLKYRILPLIADPKLDGMRMTIDAAKNPISRKGKDILTADHIAEDLSSFFEAYPDVTLDGELYNHDYKEDFNTLMSIARQSKPTADDLKIAKKKLQFHIYDCKFTFDPNTKALDRKKWLKTTLKKFKFKSIKLVKYKIVKTQAELDKVKEQNLIDGYEGTITRGCESIYENKRSLWLLKHKDFITEEFKITDIIEGKGNRSGMAGNITIQYKNGTVDPGIRGNIQYFKKLLDNKDDYIGKLATVQHFGETPDGSLRFPVCIDIDRKDL